VKYINSVEITDSERDVKVERMSRYILKKHDEYFLLIWPNGSKLGRKYPWKVLYK
jgi:hypothetical protein